MDAIAIESAGIAQGCSVLFDACAAALLNEPSQQIIDDMKRVAQLLGDNRFDRFGQNDDLTQRYYDRFFVSNTPVFVPLSENCMLTCCMTDDGPQYGSVEGIASDHVLRCYRAVGFDPARLQGFQPALQNARVDSLACECAFVAFLKSKEAAADSEAEAQHLAQLADEFVGTHLGCWIRTVSACASRSDDDFYAELCAFAADAVDALFR